MGRQYPDGCRPPTLPASLQTPTDGTMPPPPTQPSRFLEPNQISRGSVYDPSSFRNPGRAPSNAPRGPRHPAIQRLASGYGRQSIAMTDQPYPQHQTNTRYLDPSAAPSPSTATTTWRQPGNRSNQSYSRLSRRVFEPDAVCKLSNFKREDYRLGDMITMAHHVPNSNKYLRRDCEFLSFSKYGPVFTKRRLFVVLAIHQRHLDCLALYTHEGKGVSHKSVEERDEYVPVNNSGEVVASRDPGGHPAVMVKCRKPVTAQTFIHVTEILNVGFNADVMRIGRMERVSWERLRELWQRLTIKGQTVPWTD